MGNLLVLWLFLQNREENRREEKSKNEEFYTGGSCTVNLTSCELNLNVPRKLQYKDVETLIGEQ